MDSALLIFLPKDLVEIVGKYHLQPCIKSAGISFEDVESQKNGITLLCRYEIDSLGEGEMNKEWIKDPSRLAEWVTVLRGAKRMLEGDSPLGYAVGMNPQIKVADGEIVMLCHIEDPMMVTLRPTSDGKYVTHSSCGMCDYDPYSLESLGRTEGKSHDRDYCLSRRKRVSRRNIEVRKLDLSIHGKQMKDRFSRCRFTFKITDYKFSNKDGEIERMKKGYENFPLRNQSPSTQRDADRYTTRS